MAFLFIGSKMEKQQTHAEMFVILQEALWKYGDLVQLSEICGISVSTLYRYRNCGNKFPWPRMSTWEKILEPLNLRLSLQHIGS